MVSTLLLERSADLAKGLKHSRTGWAGTTCGSRLGLLCAYALATKRRCWA